MTNNLLTVKDLSVSVQETGKPILRNVSLTVKEHSILALVGGSGSGKTTIGLSVLKLLGRGLKVESGEIIFEGKNILANSEQEMYAVRGQKIAMVFQEPLYAFNPVFRIGEQIEEVLIYHTHFNQKDRKERIFELLQLVGIRDPQRVASSYPHQLSGGLRQRAMIAQAIALEPKLIIADEPTSNLDVTLQAKVIELFQELKTRLKLSFILISHDLGMVSHLSDEVVVMTEGKVVEAGVTREIVKNPKNPYTQKLLAYLCS